MIGLVLGVAAASLAKGPPPRQLNNDELGYKAPAINEFVIVPLDFRSIEETRGLVEVLSRRFPGVKFKLEPLAPLPDRVLNERGQVRAEVIISKLRNRPGTIAIVGKDLSEEGANFIYGYMDPTTSNGVVSVSRFRTPRGTPAPDDVVLNDDARALATTRLQNQLTSTIAKSFGMSFPCSEQKCVLRYPRRMSEFDEKGGEFCPAHVAELRRITESRLHPDGGH